MANIDAIRQIALSLPQVTEQPHFEKTSFRVNKNIFATVVPQHSRATVKLSLTDQDVFCTFDNTVIYPVPNKWGKQGWTHVNLLTVREDMLTEILKAAYCEVAPKHLAAQVEFDN
jgi:hypothetical protein